MPFNYIVLEVVVKVTGWELVSKRERALFAFRNQTDLGSHPTAMASTWSVHINESNIFPSKLRAYHPLFDAHILFFILAFQI